MSKQITKEMIIKPLHKIEKELRVINLGDTLYHMTINDIIDITKALSEVKFQLNDLINVIKEIINVDIVQDLWNLE